MLEISEFRCYEVKIEESEKAGYKNNQISTNAIGAKTIKLHLAQK